MRYNYDTAEYARSRLRHSIIRLAGEPIFIRDVQSPDRAAQLVRSEPQQDQNSPGVNIPPDTPSQRQIDWGYIQDTYSGYLASYRERDIDLSHTVAALRNDHPFYNAPFSRMFQTRPLPFLFTISQMPFRLLREDIRAQQLLNVCLRSLDGRAFIERACPEHLQFASFDSHSSRRDWILDNSSNFGEFKQILEKIFEYCLKPSYRVLYRRGNIFSNKVLCAREEIGGRLFSVLFPLTSVNARMDTSSPKIWSFSAFKALVRCVDRGIMLQSHKFSYIVRPQNTPEFNPNGVGLGDQAPPNLGGVDIPDGRGDVIFYSTLTEPYLSQQRNQRRGETYSVRANNPDLDLSVFPLGYAKFAEDENRLPVYIYRNSARSYIQGLNRNNIASVRAGTSNDFQQINLMSSKLAECIRGTGYSTLPQALEHLEQVTNGRQPMQGRLQERVEPIGRDVAVSFDGLGPVCLWLRNRKIGYSDDGNRFTLGRNLGYLREELESKEVQVA